MHIEIIDGEEFFIGEIFRLKRDTSGRGGVKECGCPEACTAIYELMSRIVVGAKMTKFDSIIHMDTDRKSLNISIDIDSISENGFKDVKETIRKLIDEKLQELNDYGCKES